MNFIRRKMSSSLIDAANKAIDALDPQCPCARELDSIEVEDVLKEDIDRICAAATIGEITKIAMLATRLKKSSGQEVDEIEVNLKRLAEQLVTRVEGESGKLRMPATCRSVLLGF